MESVVFRRTRLTVLSVTPFSDWVFFQPYSMPKSWSSASSFTTRSMMGRDLMISNCVRR